MFLHHFYEHELITKNNTLLVFWGEGMTASPIAQGDLKLTR